MIPHGRGTIEADSFDPLGAHFLLRWEFLIPGLEFFVGNSRLDIPKECREKKVDKFAKKYLPYITTSTINGQEYLQKHLLSFLWSYEGDTLFWPGLASCRYAKPVMEWYEANGGHSGFSWTLTIPINKGRRLGGTTVMRHSHDVMLSGGYGEGKGQELREFDIDLVFRQSSEGLRIMELLRQENSVNSKLIKSITTVLSDYLVRRFGYHPNAYNVLKSSSTAIPHALWFYPHGRGQGKHSGKIHYHIEYMVKKYKQQVHQPRRLGNVDTIDGDDNNMLQASEIQNDSIERLKYIVPTDASLEVIKNDWGQTFGARKIIRDNGDDAKLVDELLEAFPLMIEFSGSLV
ncbi:uncharacterized protein LOC135717187 [Ochlerotatus camptorhynchus]|uniref:uncharacterized protein LOC135717187 n=1 Tax=Ochlerotatus camptorhynchus TaxID=644619 RepID=UPI0031CEF704